QFGLSAFIVGVGLVGILCVAALYEGLSRAVYTVTGDYIQEEYGVLYRRLRQIPLSYVRDVTCTQNLVQRVFGLSSIRVSPTNGNKIVVSNIRIADSAQRRIWKTVLQTAGSTVTAQKQ